MMNPKKAIKDYGYRFGAIETVFKSQNSNGFYLESTVNASLKYFESMYCMACFGILFLTILGTEYTSVTKILKSLLRLVNLTKLGFFLYLIQNLLYFIERMEPPNILGFLSDLFCMISNFFLITYN